MGGGIRRGGGSVSSGAFWGSVHPRGATGVLGDRGCPGLTPHLDPPVSSPPQVARAGRFGTKGLAITFVSDENDAKILNDVQDRFEVNISELPDEIDISSYSEGGAGGAGVWGERQRAGLCTVHLC